MIKYQFKKFRQDRSFVELIDVLSLLPDNNWDWAILYFDGVGSGPNGISYEEFVAVAGSSPIGFKLTWVEFKEFARRLEDSWDILAVACKSIDMIDRAKIDKEDYEGCVAVIEEFDSSDWAVYLDSPELSSGISLLTAGS